jgi:hypothetical protein
MMPMTAVIMPPVLNEMYFGARFEKSNEGETTFAAMFVEIWAITIMIIARIRTRGRLPASCVMSATGSQTASPKTTIVAAVTAIPIKENAVIVRGNPRACPMIWERWVFA